VAAWQHEDNIYFPEAALKEAMVPDAGGRIVRQNRRKCGEFEEQDPCVVLPWISFTINERGGSGREKHEVFVEKEFYVVRRELSIIIGPVGGGKARQLMPWC